MRNAISIKDDSWAFAAASNVLVSLQGNIEFHNLVTAIVGASVSGTLVTFDEAEPKCELIIKNISEHAAGNAIDVEVIICLDYRP